jgi:hypothetical protein
MRAAPLVKCASILALSLTAAQAADPPTADPLQPLAFLAGHCYRGEVGRGDSDEHCFGWILGGKALRDVHAVRGAGHADYAGETTYYYDWSARRIEYLYVENAGGVMRGIVEPGDGTLVFPATTYVANGVSMTLRVSWTRAGDGYEAWSEARQQAAWVTMFKARMTRTS